MREWFTQFIKKYYNPLLKLDLRVARIFGAPKGWTISGNAYRLEQEGKPWGKALRPLIDFLFYPGHCFDAYTMDVRKQSA
jgi:hypothetical protein